MGRLSIRKGDTVEVIAGKERGKRGKVLKVFPNDGKLLVEKLNVMKRHVRPSQKYRQGGIIDKEMPIDVSNVMILCKKCEKPVRIRKKFLKDGTKERVCAKCGEGLV